MGLDMYLDGKRYVSRWLNKDDEKVSKAVAELFPELARFDTTSDDVIREITIRAGYWRKANHIHSWFVREVQDGVDECRPHYVSREKLKELLRICETLLIDCDPAKAEEVLAPKSGFFFGSTDIDEYYWQDLKDTVKIINFCLSLPEDWDFEYRSSW